MNLKRKVATLLIAGISIFGVACGDSNGTDDIDDDPLINDTPGEEFTPSDPIDPTDDGSLTP